jgi:hypothetical protein
MGSKISVKVTVEAMDGEVLQEKVITCEHHTFTSVCCAADGAGVLVMNAFAKILRRIKEMKGKENG